MDTSRQDKCFFIPKNINQKIKKTNILIVGCGGVGSIIADLCVRGGFENINLIDSEIIEESNLQRQLFYYQDIGKPKAKITQKHLLNINPKANINYYIENLTKENIEEKNKNIDVIIDATDNIQTRLIIDEYCKKYNKSWIYSGAAISESTSAIITPKINFKKIMLNKNDQSCCEIGVLSSTTHITASLVYNNLIKLITNQYKEELIKINAWNNLFFNIKLH